MTPKQKRERIKFILSQLEDSNRMIFKRMYSHTDLEKDINLVVDDMPPKNLDWALSQCNNSYYGLLNLLKVKNKDEN